MKISNPVLSVVTPAYNRAHLLSGCYESLRRQTCKDFEWIIVDDGSRDDTARVADSFADAGFPIIYIKKENGGKHTALNASHPHIRGKYVLILDSDDSLTETAVAAVLEQWGKYEAREDIGVVTFLRITPEGTLFAYVNDYDTPVDLLTYPRAVNLGNDCCEVIRAELFKKYPFPVFEGERFLSEGVLWSQVAKTHKCVYVNNPIYLCEYLADGLTQAGRALRIRNPRGGMLSASFGMGRENSLRQRIKSGLLYTCYGFFAGLSPVQMVKQCVNHGLMWLCLPFGAVLYRYWKRKFL